jgi:hypothetical protein
MFTHAKKMVIRKGKIKSTSKFTSKGVIKRFFNVTSHENLRHIRQFGIMMCRSKNLILI